MKEKLKELTKNIWFDCFVAACVVILILIISIIVNRQKNTNALPKESAEQTENSKIEDNFIRIDEDLSMMGRVKNLDNVSWGSARISQHDGQAELFVMLNNESEKDKVESTELKVNLLNKKGKVIATKTTTIDGIAANYGYKDLELTFDMSEAEIVYDVQIVANKLSTDENKTEDKEDTEAKADADSKEENKTETKGE